jgi:hypothetical protein
MEKFSKKRRRRKRGRPVKYRRADYESAGDILTGLTVRSHQNGINVHMAACGLGMWQEAFNKEGVSIDWLYNQKTERIRRTMLAGIGRLKPEDAQICAYAICRDRLKTKSALKLIRWFRNGKLGLTDLSVLQAPA